MGPEALGGGYSDILSIFNDFLRRGMSSLLVADRDGSHVRGLRQCKFGLIHPRSEIRCIIIDFRALQWTAVRAVDSIDHDEAN